MATGHLLWSIAGTCFREEVTKQDGHMLACIALHIQTVAMLSLVTCIRCTFLQATGLEKGGGGHMLPTAAFPSRPNVAPSSPRQPSTQSCNALLCKLGRLAKHSAAAMVWNAGSMEAPSVLLILVLHLSSRAGTA